MHALVLLLALLLGDFCFAQTMHHESGSLRIVGGAVTAVQFDAPAGQVVGPGPALMGLGKDLTCDQFTRRCVVAGLNSTVLSDAGVIAVIDGPGVPTNILGTTAAAAAGGIVIPLALSPCDLTQDGSIDSVDLLHVVTKIIDQTACGAADLDADGLCTVVDAQRVANASVSGGVCVAGS